MPSSGRDRVLFDTYAWIEYFRGSEEGETVRKYIESKTEILTPTIVLAELSDKYRRTGKEEEWGENRREIVELRSRIVTLSPDSADEAGSVKNEMRERYGDYPLADGLIMSIAKEKECKVLTGDKHMRESEKAINLKEETNSGE